MENIDALHIEIVISILNLITKFYRNYIVQMTIVYPSLKKYDSHLIMEELSKFNLNKCYTK